jgi:hypothetical protein
VKFSVRAAASKARTAASGGSRRITSTYKSGLSTVSSV